MNERDITTATPYQLRKMVAVALGYTILYENEEREVVSGYLPGWNGEIVPQVPLWDRDLLAALGLLPVFEKRYQANKDKLGVPFQQVYLTMTVCSDLSGVIGWEVGEYGKQCFNDLTQDGPVAICKAFLQAMTQLDEVLSQEGGD